MKITLSELKKRSSEIETLIIRSVDLPILLPFVRMKDGTLYQVYDKAGKPIKESSQLLAKKHFKGFGITHCVLAHFSPYNEMVGIDGGNGIDCEIPIQTPDEDYT